MQIVRRVHSQCKKKLSQKYGVKKKFKPQNVYCIHHVTPYNTRLLQCAQQWRRPVCLYEVIALSQSEAWKAPRYEVTIGHSPLQRRVTVGHLTYIHYTFTTKPLLISIQKAITMQ